MITKETCEKIWHCHREIEVSKSHIENVERYIQKSDEYRKANEFSREVKDTFGGSKGIEMCIPSNGSGSSKSIYNISPRLALSIIYVHIANKEAELADLHEISKIQIMGG